MELTHSEALILRNYLLWSLPEDYTETFENILKKLNSNLEKVSA